MSLTPKQRRFVNEYCVDENATRAAIRSGCPEASAHVTACRWLKEAKIQEAIAERMEEVAVAASITPEFVVAQWAAIARADSNELSQLRRVCCRHCHGYGHQYQWTEAEYTAAVNTAIDSGKPAPDGMGGFGYDPKAEPNPDCPECGGEGYEETYFADTRKLKGSAKVLYAGVKRTRNGIEILTRDKDAAVANLARYLGMMVDKKELSGPGGGPIPMASLTADDLTDDQLAAILKVDDVADEA